MNSYLEKGFKLAFVGGAGTGKTTIARLSSYALRTNLFEAGEWQRKMAGDRQVETNPQAVKLENDRLVDGKMIELLTQTEESWVFHGRTPRLLAEQLIKENKLNRYKFLMAAVECRPWVRAARGLNKFREKYDPKAEQVDVLKYHNERDKADFERFKELYKESHELKRSGYLVDINNEFTRGFPLSSDMLKPKDELLMVLFVLHNFKHISDTGFALAFMRGLAYSPKKD